MTITYRNGISIGEIVVYVPGLAIAIFLSVRHGFRRNAGWMFLIIFCLLRLIGPAMQLATISDPTNISLYSGSAILANVGLSPLELAALGLLSRLLDSIHKTRHTFVDVKMFRLIELVIMVGLILGIVGGVNAADDYQTSGIYQPGTLNKAGTSLFIVSYVFIVVATILLSFHVNHAEHGERRIFLAVALSLPFLLVRLIYSIFSTFTHNRHFNLLEGSPTVLLCVALLEELVVVILYEGTGLTLKPLEPTVHAEGQPINTTEYDNVQQPKKQGGAGNVALRIAKGTIIGRIIMSFVPEKNNRDVEMQQGARR